MRHCLLVLLLLACEKPTASTTVAPAPPAVPAPVVEFRDESGVPFPSHFYGRWNCTAHWHTSELPREDGNEAYEEGDYPTTLQLVMVSGHVRVEAEGCSFRVSPVRPRNPMAWDLYPARCGEWTFRSGFLILSPTPYGRMMLAQVNGDRAFTQRTINYDCDQDPQRP